MNERSLIQPMDIKREIERLMGRTVGFSWVSSYDLPRDLALLRFTVDVGGDCIDACVTQHNRALSMDEFSSRILQPMVAKARALGDASQDMPEGCVAGWISEEA